MTKTKTLRATDEEIRAARIEFYALQSAGLRPESLVRKLSQAPSMFTEQIEGRAPWIGPAGDADFPESRDDRMPAEPLERLPASSPRDGTKRRTESIPQRRPRAAGKPEDGDFRAGAPQGSRRGPVNPE